MAYEYEVFVSYRRAPPVADWVHDHFKRLLMDWLGVERPVTTRVFVDDTLETGVTWPLALKQTILRSCFLVPVFSPGYFSSQWCLAELHSMLARERELGMRTDENPEGLIFPVRFNDGEHFPEDIRAIQDLDLRRLNIPGEAFRRTERYVDLIDKIQEFTQLLAGKLDAAPPWRDGWPVEMPDGGGPPEVALPRLR